MDTVGIRILFNYLNNIRILIYVYYLIIYILKKNLFVYPSKKILETPLIFFMPIKLNFAP